MPVKSILDIELNDARFREFAKLFDKYQASLKKMPAAWKLVNEKIDGSRSSFDKLVDSMVAGNIQEKLREKAQARANELTKTAADRWASLARSSRTFATHIKDATTSLLKWSAITGVIAGLAGAGGLWGIDRLALGVSAGRRSSLGIGTSFGGQQAFGANFQQLIDDPQSFLGAIAGAKYDINKRVGLMSAGLSQEDIAGDTTSAAIKVLRTLKREADTWNPMLYRQRLDALRQSQFASPELLSVLHGTSQPQFEKLIGQFGVRSSQADRDVPPDVAQKWQDLTTQLTNANNSIFNTFVRGLAPLAPGLTKLSESVEKVIRSFLDSPTLAQWIKELDVGLEKFAGYIGTPEFQDNVRTFVRGVGALAHGVARFIGWFGGSSSGGRHDAISHRIARMNVFDRKYRREHPDHPISPLGGLFDWYDKVGLKKITTASGQTVTVAAADADRWKRFLGDMEAAGAPINRVEGYNRRKIAGTNVWSEHASGRAVDIDQSGRDDVSPEFRAWMARNSALMRKLEAHYGIRSGGDFKSPDLGHFEVIKGTRYDSSNNVTIRVENNTGGNAVVTANGCKN